MYRLIAAAAAALALLSTVAPSAALPNQSKGPGSVAGISGPVPAPVVYFAGPGDANTSVAVADHLGASFGAGEQVATATFEVTYTGFTPAAQAAFQRGVEIWSQLVTSSVPIKINAKFEPLGANVLGSAGPTGIWRDFANAPVAATWYPVALAEALGATDLNPGQADIDASFNSTFPSWNFGLDGQPQAGRYDFISTVLHEIGHGLGFFGSMSVAANGNGSWGYQDAGGAILPMAYDRFTQNLAGTALLNTATFPNPSLALGNELKSGNVFFSGPKANVPDVQRPELHAPATWNGGSSYSHWDEFLYRPGSLNALMTPVGSAAEVNHTPGPLALCLFEDIGWVTPESCAPPPNDAFSSAQVIAGPAGTVTGTNVGATKQAGEPNHASGNVGGPSIWYSWTAPATGIYTFDTLGSGTGTVQIDTMLAVYRGNAVNSLTLVTNNNNAGSVTSVAGPLLLTGGVPYKIAIDGFKSPGFPPATGSTRLTWSEGPVERVSVNSTAQQANDASLTPDISTDGRVVAFESYASNIVEGDNNIGTDIFARDRSTGATTRLNVSPAGTQAEPSFSISSAPAISADGRYVAFNSDAANLVPVDTNTWGDVFVRDLQTTTTSRVSLGDAEQEGDGGTFGRPAISADGRYVAFQSHASNLVAGDGNFQADIFLRDRTAGTTVRVNVDSDEVEADQQAENPGLLTSPQS